MYHLVLQHHMEGGEVRAVVAECKQHGSKDPALWTHVLRWFANEGNGGGGGGTPMGIGAAAAAAAAAAMGGGESGGGQRSAAAAEERRLEFEEGLEDVLNHIAAFRLVPPLRVLQIMGSSKHTPLACVQVRGGRREGGGGRPRGVVAARKLSHLTFSPFLSLSLSSPPPLLSLALSSSKPPLVCSRHPLAPRLSSQNYLSGVLAREDETIADDGEDIAETSASVGAMRREIVQLRASEQGQPIMAVSQADLELPNVHFKGMNPLAGGAGRAAQQQQQQQQHDSQAGRLAMAEGAAQGQPNAANEVCVFCSQDTDHVLERFRQMQQRTDNHEQFFNQLESSAGAAAGGGPVALALALALALLPRAAHCPACSSYAPPPPALRVPPCCCRRRLRCRG